mmetsp:Transcript_4820/g.12102  ORF Transcript_4820/g.12102 Transcript_4820/m.12102 type:complete len:354 (-) Transcript_4820:132-1193(-)
MLEERIERTLDEVIKTDWKRPGKGSNQNREVLPTDDTSNADRAGGGAARQVRGKVATTRRKPATAAASGARGAGVANGWRGVMASAAVLRRQGQGSGKGRGKGKTASGVPGRGARGVKRTPLLLKQGRGNGTSSRKGGAGGAAGRKGSTQSPAGKKSGAKSGARGGKGKGSWDIAIAGGQRSRPKGGRGKGAGRGWNATNLASRGAGSGKVDGRYKGKANNDGYMVRGGGGFYGKGSNGNAPQKRKRMPARSNDDSTNIKQPGAKRGKGQQRYNRVDAVRDGGGGDAAGWNGDPETLSAEDRKLMKNITVVAQLDKVPEPAADFYVFMRSGGANAGGRDRGPLSSRFGADDGH